MLNLIKKDFLIVKNLTLITMGVIIVVPVFFTFMAPEVPGFFTLFYMVIIGTIMLLQAISQEEAKYPKAVSLICSTPYSRKSYVLAKYLVALTIFGYCCIVDYAVKIIINPNAIVSFGSLLLVLLAGVIVFSTYMPVEIKYGAVKARYFYSVTIILFSLGPSMLTQLLPNVKIDLSFLNRMPSMPVVMAQSLSILVILALSLIISVNMFSKKEL